MLTGLQNNKQQKETDDQFYHNNSLCGGSFNRAFEAILPFPGFLPQSVIWAPIVSQPFLFLVQFPFYFLFLAVKVNVVLGKNAFLLNKYTETPMTHCAKVVETFNLNMTDG